MENFFKSSFKSTYNYFKSMVSSNKNYKLVERQNKIIYFSAFNLELNEFEIIHNYVKKIKENVFKKLLDATKYTVKQIISIENVTQEKQKVLILFSACFMHYYTNFSYDICPSFNLFFTENFLNLCRMYKIKILNHNQFKVFCFSFYYQMINELKQFKYDLIKAKLFNKKINNLNSNLKLEKGIADKKLILPIISAKETIVDMVYLNDKSQNESQNTNDNDISMENFNAKNETEGQNLGVNNALFDIFNTSTPLSNNSISTNSNSNIINSESTTTNTNKYGLISPNIFTENNKSSGNIVQNKIIIKNGEVYPQIPNNAINFNSNFGAPLFNCQEPYLSNSRNNSPSNQNSQITSQRLFGELTKNTLDEESAEVMKNVTKNISVDFFDNLLYEKNIKDIELISPFICYILEIKSYELASKISCLPNDYFFRFIFCSKNLYLQAMEIYFSINDLANTEMKTFEYVIKAKFGLNNIDKNSGTHSQNSSPSNNEINERFIKSLFYFYKKIADEFNGQHKDNENIFNKVINDLQNDWKECIMKKCQDLTSFCSA